jgi:type I restriction enzyme S subunit
MASAPSTPKAGWEVKTLGEVCRIELGKTPARNNSSYWDKERQTDNVWLSIADLPKRNLAVVDDSKEYISEEGSTLCKIVPEGTLMVSFKLTLGRLAYAGKDLYTNEAIASLYVLDETLFAKHYIFYYLTFFDWDKAAEGHVKIKGKTLNKKKLKELKIIVPPLAEQERIVGILDEAFEGIATATAQAEKNLHNARELFQSVLQSTFSQKGDDWVETTLGEVCGITSKLADPQEKEFIDLLHVGGANIETDSGELHGLKTAREEQLISGKFPFDESMVLYSKIRPYLKKVSRPAFRGLCSADIYPLAPIEDILERDFLFHLFANS